MAARSVWTGHVRFKSVSFGVKVFSGVNSDGIRFNQLHKTDHGRIKQNSSCSKCGEDLKKDDIVKGYEVAPDQYVVIDSEDLDAAKAENNKVIEIDAFVSVDEVGRELYNQPHILGTDKQVSERGYALLRDTLTATNTCAVGRIVIRDSESPILIEAKDGALALHKLRYPDTIRTAADVGVDVLPEAEADEIALASQLVETMRKKFDRLELVDQTRKTLMEIIEAKVNNSEFINSSKDDQGQASTIDLMDALRKSIPKPKRKAKAKAKAKRKAA